MRLDFTLGLFLGVSLRLASASRLIQRSASPSPIAIAPSQNWDGSDGPWSSFTIQVGTPIQNVRVFISPVGSNAWVVGNDGCKDNQATCKEDRGRTFDLHASQTYQNWGPREFGVERPLGLSLQANFGNDTLGLGLQGSGGPVLKSQAVFTYTDAAVQLGMFGVNAASTNFSNDDGNYPSYLSQLKRQNKIPSLSFGYTAGNQYRLKKVYGSLTLGGYDSSLFTPNQLTIPFVGDDATRYLQVSIQKMTSKEQTGKTSNLLPTPILAAVDSTVPMIWLPTEACKAFEAAFGLKYDTKTNLYLVDDDLHSSLQEKNASVTFTISNQTTGGQTMDLVLPYIAFDLLIKPPYPGINETSRYFPLRRAANESQYTLGRTFLQETYLKVDWERRNFSLSQCVFSPNAKQKLVTIRSPTAPGPGLSAPVKIGVAIGVIVGTLLVIALLTWLYLRWRNARRRAAKKAAWKGANPKEGDIRQGFAKGEMGTGIENTRYEMEGSDGNALKPYGGRTPPWVDEKAQYPRLGSNDVAEMESEGQRAELVGAIGFYGGRGVHEMYDPSSVPPIELPTGTEEEISPRMGDTGRSTRSSSSKPSPSKMSIFGPFARRKGRVELDSSGPSPQSSPSHPPSHTVSGPSSPLSPQRSSPRHLYSPFDERPRRPRHDSNQTSSGPSGPSSPSSPDRHISGPTSAYNPHFSNRTFESLNERSRPHFSSNPRTPGTSLPSLPNSPTRPMRPPRHSAANHPEDISPPSHRHRNGERKERTPVSPPSSGNENDRSSNGGSSEPLFSPISRQNTFSMPGRQDTGILSPISPETEDSPDKGGFGQSRFRWGR